MKRLDWYIVAACAATGLVNAWVFATTHDPFNAVAVCVAGAGAGVIVAGARSRARRERQWRDLQKRIRDIDPMDW